MKNKAGLLAILICYFFGHQYRNAVPRPYECIVYCLRCKKEFSHFDAPLGRENARRVAELETLIKNLNLFLNE